MLSYIDFSVGNFHKYSEQPFSISSLDECFCSTALMKFLNCYHFFNAIMLCKTLSTKMYPHQYEPVELTRVLVFFFNKSFCPKISLYIVLIHTNKSFLVRALSEKNQIYLLSTTARILFLFSILDVELLLETLVRRKYIKNRCY